MKIKEQLYKILNNLSGMGVTNEKMSLQNDLGLDSLGLVTLLVEIEDSFNFELKPEDIDPFKYETVETLIKLVSKYIGDGYE